MIGGIVMSTKWIKNVRLETAAKTDENGYGFTETELFHLKIKDGKIVEKIKAVDYFEEDTHKSMDAKGYLAVPTFKEMHNHLDKTYMTLGWKSAKYTKVLKERLQNEAEELVELAPTTKQRASKMIETLLSKGSTHIRTHVNIDPYIGLKNLEGVLEALDEYKGVVTSEVIAFPQHGLLLNSEVPKLMKEAMRNGATMVGGLDPAGIDRSIEKSLNLTMDLAAEFDADVDIHIHDNGHMGWYTIDKWIDLIEDAGWKGRCAVSHGFSMGEISQEKQHELAVRLKEQEMMVMSNVSLAKNLPPYDLLDHYGVGVHFGFDGFYDSWSPLGTGDLLEKVNNYCQITGKKDEHSIRKALKFCTGGITPLDEHGKQQWPKVGDQASFVFADASCSAELIARKPDRKAIMVDGNVVYGKM